MNNYIADRYAFMAEKAFLWGMGDAEVAEHLRSDGCPEVEVGRAVVAGSILAGIALRCESIVEAARAQGID